MSNGDQMKNTMYAISATARMMVVIPITSMILKISLGLAAII